MMSLFFESGLRRVGGGGRCRWETRWFGRIAALGFVALAGVEAGAATVTFEDLSPTIPGAGGGFYENGSNLVDGQFLSGGATFPNAYDSQFDSWSGFAYSTTSDVLTPGFGNQFSAFPGGGAGGSATYAVGFDLSSFGGLSPEIVIPVGYRASEIKLANTTYAALYMRDGSSPPFDPPSPYGGADGTAPDFFSVRVTGRRDGMDTGSVDFFLADYRAPGTADDYVVEDWATLDLTPVGNAERLVFSFDSSDVGGFGINTPLYVAVDDLVLDAIPEPSPLLFLGFSAVFMAWIGLRRR